MSDLDKLQRTVKYTFKDTELLTRAVTHRSHGATNNERLEFLGDAILNFVVAETLFNRFTKAREGQLSRMRARLARQQTLAEIARDFGVGDYLIMGSGELKSGGFDRDSILSDTLEAIIGAMFLDGGLDQTRGVIIDWYREHIEELSLSKSQKDPKTRLQELLQSRQANLPQYVIVDTTGQSHDRVFVVECQSKLLDSPVRGTGTSRRAAEQEAARLALDQLCAERDPGHV